MSGDGVLIRMRALLAGVNPGRDKVALIVSNGHGNVLLTDEQARMDEESWP
jgi:hypothetical protein